MLLFQPNNALPPLWKIFLAWLFREFSWIAFFLQAACGREIEWRTSHFVLRLGGKAERLQEKCQDLNNHCCWTEINTSLPHTVVWPQSTELAKSCKSNFMVSLWNLAFRNLWELTLGDSFQEDLTDTWTCWTEVISVLSDDCTAVPDARVLVRIQGALVLYWFCVERWSSSCLLSNFKV